MHLPVLRVAAFLSHGKAVKGFVSDNNMVAERNIQQASSLSDPVGKRLIGIRWRAIAARMIMQQDRSTPAVDGPEGRQVSFYR